MKFRLRTLFLITTVVAIIAFAFTLGSAEGVFALFFFAAIFATTPKKDRWKSGLLTVLILLGPGIYSWHSMKSKLGLPNNGESACVEIVYIGCGGWKRLYDIQDFLCSEKPSGFTGVGNYTHIAPFVSHGYVRIYFKKGDISKNEAEVRQKLAKEFPDLKVTIKSYSVSDSKD